MWSKTVSSLTGWVSEVLAHDVQRIYVHRKESGWHDLVAVTSDGDEILIDVDLTVLTLLIALGCIEMGDLSKREKTISCLDDPTKLYDVAGLVEQACTEVLTDVEYIVEQAEGE